MSRVALGELTSAICNTLLSPAKHAGTFFSPSKAGSKQAPPEKIKAECQVEIDDAVADLEQALSAVQIDNKENEHAEKDETVDDEDSDSLEEEDSEEESEIGPEDDPEQDVDSEYDDDDDDDEDEEEEEDMPVVPEEAVIIIEERFEELQRDHGMTLLKPSVIKFGKKVHNTTCTMIDQQQTFSM
jgi:hypothetical protein